MSCTATVGLNAADQLDDRLLLAVAEVALREGPDVQCVRQNLPGPTFGDVSDWLLEQLRRRRPKLVRCPDGAASLDVEELWLGPVVWWERGKEGRVFWGPPVSLIGQDGFHVRRGRFGRWRFTRVVRE
jgi:hypothetical protein